jgi:ABC-2 type transport system permease protein
MVLKEFLQLRRDRVTFGMIIGIPIVQLALFGFAINSDPKHMPMAIISADHSEMTRTLIASMKTSEYFDIVGELPNVEAGHSALAQGKVLFVLNIPAGFTRSMLRGERPALLVEADATDPVATGMALASVSQLTQSVTTKDLIGPLAYLSNGRAPFEIRVHRLYNPEGITQYNIIPGLMGVVLTMTMVMMTGLAITRERERGTMENLLAMPAKPIEVLIGKIIPYIADGGYHPVFASTKPAAGHADDHVLLSSEPAAFRFHVSVSWDAEMGAVHWQSVASDLLQPVGSRHISQR